MLPLIVKKALLQSDWNENEIVAYSTLLLEGPLSLKKLSKEIGMPVSSLQYVLKKLSSKKMTKRRTVNDRPLYYAAPPESLISWINEYEKKYKSYKKSIENFVSTYEPKPEHFIPQVKFYTKKQGVKASYQEVIENCKSKEVCSFFTAPDDLDEEFKNFILDDFIPKRRNKSIRNKNIALNSSIGRKYRDNSEFYLNETQLLPKCFADCTYIDTTEINIFDEYVHCMTYSKDQAFATMIMDRGLSHVLKMVFDYQWILNDLVIAFKGKSGIENSYRSFFNNCSKGEIIYSFEGSTKLDIQALKNRFSTKIGLQIEPLKRIETKGEILINGSSMLVVNLNFDEPRSFILRDTLLVNLVKDFLI